MSKNMRISFYVLLMICSISFIVSTFLIISHLQQEKKILAEAKTNSLNEVKRSAEKVEELLKSVEATADSIASSAGSDLSNNTALNDRLKEILEKDLDITEISIAHAPYIRDPEVRLYAPSAEMKDDKVMFFQMEAYNDYTQASWYKDTVAAGSPTWSEPFMDERIKNCVVSYNVPFSLPGAEKGIAGVVHVTISLGNIRKYASSLELGNAIMRFIISKKGLFVYYPLNEVVENQTNILDAIKEMKDHRVEEKLKKVLSGENIFFESKDPASNSTYMSFYEHVPSTGWCVVCSYLQEQFTLSEITFRRQQIQIIIALIVFLTTLTAILSGACLLTKKSLWITSVTLTLLCLIGTLYVWSIIFTAPLKQDNNRIFLTDRVRIQKALSKFESYVMKTRMKHPVRIPTGIYLQSLEFNSSNDLKAVGYIWLKYPVGIEREVMHEPTFPEATTLNLKEVSCRNEGDYEVMRWRFEATIRESFDYSKFPLDRPDIWLWMKSGDPDNREILIPDLDSYKATSPQACPGLPDEGIVFPGYTIMGTYFEYRQSIATTDFGVKKIYDLETFPELYYHVAARRNIMNPFVSKVFPLLIMLSMLFVVKLKFTNNEEEKTIFGINGIGVLGTVISFFFSTMLSQSTLRTEINVERITFLENFHLITYFMLFYMAVTTFFFIGRKKPSILEYEDCLLSKILYWPLVTGLILMATVIYYY